jgi:CBS domain containing-hemolysin-like protein
MTLLITLTVLMVVHGFFVAAEYAIVKTAYANKTSTQATAQSKRTLSIFARIEEHLAVCQLARTIVLLSMGLLLGLVLSKASMGDGFTVSLPGWEKMVWLALSFIGIVVAQIIVGNELPRKLGICRSDWCTEALGRHLILCRWCLWPILTIVKRIKQSLSNVG